MSLFWGLMSRFLQNPAQKSTIAGSALNQKTFVIGSASLREREAGCIGGGAEDAARRG
jgi:hypothetical protein